MTHWNQHDNTNAVKPWQQVQMGTIWPQGYSSLSSIQQFIWKTGVMRVEGGRRGWRWSRSCLGFWGWDEVFFFWFFLRSGVILASFNIRGLEAELGGAEERQEGDLSPVGRGWDQLEARVWTERRGTPWIGQSTSHSHSLLSVKWIRLIPGKSDLRVPFIVWARKPFKTSQLMSWKVTSGGCQPSCAGGELHSLLLSLEAAEKNKALIRFKKVMSLCIRQHIFIYVCVYMYIWLIFLIIPVTVKMLKIEAHFSLSSSLWHLAVLVENRQSKHLVVFAGLVQHTGRLPTASLSACRPPLNRFSADSDFHGK